MNTRTCILVADDEEAPREQLLAALRQAWPDADVVVHTCFPGYAPLFARVGVPLERVVWRPYPIDPGSVPPGPDPRGGGSLFAGGAHLRDGGRIAVGFGAGRGYSFAQLHADVASAHLVVTDLLPALDRKSVV